MCICRILNWESHLFLSRYGLILPKKLDKPTIAKSSIFDDDSDDEVCNILLYMGMKTHLPSAHLYRFVAHVFGVGEGLIRCFFPMSQI